MINPTSITNFDRTTEELEEFWIFCIVVAGKNADWAARTVSKLLQRKGERTPFEFLSEAGNALHNTLVANRVGQYNRITQAINASLALDLRNCTVEDLESLPGVGPKTARFFLVHTRRDCCHAVLDTHALKWLRSLDVTKVPNAISSRKQYLQLERLFLGMAKALFGDLPVAQIDLLIWSVMSGRLDMDLPLIDDLFKRVDHS